jgi:hypothetical protein
LTDDTPLAPLKGGKAKVPQGGKGKSPSRGERQKSLKGGKKLKVPPWGDLGGKKRGTMNKEQETRNKKQNIEYQNFGIKKT